MKIDSIKLKDFRGFDDREFSFNSQFNVLIGENGSGKTTLLESLAIAINSYISVIEGRNVRGIRKEDVRLVSYEKNIEAKLNTAISISGELENKPLSWSVGKPYIKWGFMRMNDKEIKNIAKKYIESIANDGGKEIILPVFNYLGCGRLWTESTERVKTFPKGSRLEGYHHCLSSKASFKGFTEWFKTMELSQLQGNKSAKLRADIIREVVANCLEGWDSIYYGVEEDMLMAKKEENGKESFLPFSYLSDGQRNVIGIVADIAYRCIILNPYLESNATKETPGIVLIDELDLHLHPEWQKNIVQKLKDNFPKIQFITTTHSPFIVQSLKKEELISLDVNIVIDADPFRKSIEEVASDDMSVENVQRSTLFKEMEKTAEEYYNLIETKGNQPKIKELEVKLNELEERFGSDPAFVALLKAERKSKNQ